MRKYFSRLVVAALLLFQTLVGPPLTGHAQIAARPVSDLERALKSTGTIRAILVLEGAPMVEVQRLVPQSASMMQRRQRVDFDSPDAAAIETQLRSEQEDFEARARLIAPGLRVRTTLRALANAISVEARGTEVAAMSALPGVKRVELVHDVRTFLDTSVPLINAPTMWDLLGGSGNAGAGVKIAILDTGVDLTNPMFSDAGFTAPSGFPRSNNGSQALTNNKVIVAKSFLRSSGTALDENGHGTNVAGIAAGDFGTVTPLGIISGVAPRAFLGNYRVLDKNGSGPSDLIANGLEEAVRDGFDVANMSLGADATSSVDILEQAVEAATAAGMVVCIAAGNSGNDGVGDQMTVASPGVASSAITVASVTNAHAIAASATVTGPSPVAANLSNLASFIGEGSTARFNQPFVAMPYAEMSTNRGCDPAVPGSLTGKVALIERGICTFADKVNNASAGGAVAAVIYNKDLSEGADGGDILIHHMFVPGTSIPSVFVSRTSGLALRDFVRSHPDAQLSLTPVVTADVVSSFSSRGPSIREELKPDIAAPGESIYSAAIPSVDASLFGSEMGTSQATPHITGSAALVLQRHPAWTPAQVKSALMNSATTNVFTTLDKTTKSGVLAMGSGRVDLAQAGTVTATFAPPSLSFGILKLKKKDVVTSLDVTIVNTSDQQGTYSFSVQLLDPSAGFTATLASPATVTLPPGTSTNVTLAIHAVLGVAERRDYTGLVNVAAPQGQTLHVPFWVRFVKKKV